MTCPAPERLAEAASAAGADLVAEVAEHVADCAACQAVLEEQRAIHGLVAALPDTPLARDHRAQLAAETLARADALPRLERRAERAPAEHGRVGDDRAVRVRSWRRGIAVIAGVASAAAVAFVVLAPARERAAEPVAIAPPPREPPVAPRATPAREASPPAPAVAPVPTSGPPRPTAPARAKVEGAGEFTREAAGDRDVVALTRGDVTVDSVGSRAVAVVHGDTAVVATDAKAQVVAKRGVIARVTVIAGSVEVTVAGKRVVIEQGMTWDRNAGREDSLAAFRTGWEALRTGDNAAAIAAFDQATDDVVAEDALYWGAIASERIHDPAGAVTRYRALIERFPASPRVTAAGAAIARLAP